jgi:hypothetical protein
MAAAPGMDGYAVGRVSAVNGWVEGIADIGVWRIEGTATLTGLLVVRDAYNIVQRCHRALEWRSRSDQVVSFTHRNTRNMLIRSVFR